MEKRRPTYDLRSVQAALGSIETLAMTTVALRDATAMGFGRQAVVETILSLNSKMFVKSMTTFADHRIWQDVYNAKSNNKIIYLKFQADLLTEFVVMSFKEK